MQCIRVFDMIRNNLGLSDKGFADTIGLSVSYINALRSKRRRSVSMETKRKVADLIFSSLDLLLLSMLHTPPEFNESEAADFKRIRKRAFFIINRKSISRRGDF